MHFEITRRQLANHLGYQYVKINDIIRGQMGISKRLALLLAQAFGTSPEYWAHLQAMWDIEQYKKTNPPRRIARFQTRNFAAMLLRGEDRCLCGHWGHEHIDYPEGGCVHTELGVQCTCPMYIRLAGYLAHEQLMGVPSLKERLEQLEQQQREAQAPETT